MENRSTGTRSLTEKLEDTRTYKASVVSFFDGLLAHHKALLSYGSGLCAENKEELLVVVCNADQDIGSKQSSTPSLLTPGERLDMISSFGYPNTLLWQLPSIHSADSSKILTSGLKRMLFSSKTLVPGADIWHHKQFLDLQESIIIGEERPTGTLDPKFQNTNTSQHKEMLSLLEQGHVEKMFATLGYSFPVSGFVVEGNKIGRTLGYPTANLGIDGPNKAVPGQGVYTGLVNVSGKWYTSMINIGIRPTLDMENVTIEAHLFHFEGDIYGHKISIGFLQRIRDEMRFNSLSELKQQLHRDRDVATLSLTRQMKKVRTNAFVFAGS